MRLGVARELLPKQYSARSVADALSQLMSDIHVRERCSETASRFANGDGIQAACDAILSRCAVAQ
jgi:rhamnosyltransferase subunit B